MDKKSHRRSVTIVNRLYPPFKGITGVSAYELAKYLVEERNCDVNVVHVNGNYQGGASQNEPIGKTHVVPAVYNGKQKLLRLIGNAWEGFRLTKKAKSLDDDVIIYMTDPPLLSMWAALMLKKRKTILWSMDLYPDAFTASGLVTPGNPLFKWIKRMTYRNAPNRIIALGELQHEYLEKAYNKKFEPLILPCGVYQNSISQDRPEWKKEEEKIYLGYVGNLGEAHSTEFLKSIIDALNPEKHKLLLSLYGVKSQGVIEYAKGRPGIMFLDHVPRHELQHIDVHIVSLLPKWAHVCVPSKAISAVCAHGPLIFHGDPNCDNWKMLKSAGWMIREDGDLREQVSQVLDSLNTDTIKAKRHQAEKLAGQLQTMVDRAFEKIGDEVLEKRKEALTIGDPI